MRDIDIARKGRTYGQGSDGKLPVIFNEMQQPTCPLDFQVQRVGCCHALPTGNGSLRGFASYRGPAAIGPIVLKNYVGTSDGRNAGNDVAGKWPRGTIARKMIGIATDCCPLQAFNAPLESFSTGPLAAIRPPLSLGSGCQHTEGRAHRLESVQGR